MSACENNLDYGKWHKKMPSRTQNKWFQHSQTQHSRITWTMANDLKMPRWTRNKWWFQHSQMQGAKLNKCYGKYSSQPQPAAVQRTPCTRRPTSRCDAGANDWRTRKHACDCPPTSGHSLRVWSMREKLHLRRVRWQVEKTTAQKHWHAHQASLPSYQQHCGPQVRQRRHPATLTPRCIPHHSQRSLKCPHLQVNCDSRQTQRQSSKSLLPKQFLRRFLRCCYHKNYYQISAAGMPSSSQNQTAWTAGSPDMATAFRHLY